MVPRRAASPTISESGFDISNALSNLDEAFSIPQDSNSRFNNDADLDIGFGNLYDEQDGGSEDEAFIAAQQAASNRKASNLKGRSVKKGGGFQAMGFNPTLLKAIARKGFNMPTPIQRKTIPLIMDGQDVVGMARTGSGKTAAFVLPMIEKLKSHSAKFGCRAIILSPSRELALQTLKVVKELGRGTDLRTILLIGGDSLEEQFTAMSTNPDVIIATPGRFMHLKVETGLDLSSVQYVVFDEADRLFEMGFAVQLTEIMHSLPSNRQTLLFSATLPKTLVEFTKAGLQDPHLVRLDVDSKISPDLQSAFFSLKGGDREGALLFLLEQVIKVPQGPTEAAKERQALDAESAGNKKKRKRAAMASGNKDSPTEFSTIVFAATKHCVEYLTALLKACGYAVSMVYGSLDQTARKIEVQNFRSGLSHILVVTDVAARGIDIPILANVVNYNFPSQPKIFVHRVGRTARAGRTGWSYSLVRDADVPYLLDLQLFLGRKISQGNDESSGGPNFAQDIVVGGFPSTSLGRCCEDAENLKKADFNLLSLKQVSVKAEKLYERTRNSASTESVKRAKALIQNGSIFLQNSLFSDEEAQKERERERMLSVIRGFRPQETVFELNGKGEGNELADIAKRRRTTVLNWKQRKQDEEDREELSLGGNNGAGAVEDTPTSRNNDSDSELDSSDGGGDSDSENELEISMFNDAHPASKSKSRKQASGISGSSFPISADLGVESWQDTENFVSYEPRTQNMAQDAAYSIASGTASKLADGSAAGTGASFAEAARAVTLDLEQDESRGFALASKPGAMRWDKKGRKYVSRAHDVDGSRTNTKMITSESGLKISASFKSGRFEAWKKANRVKGLPRTGENEGVLPASLRAKATSSAAGHYGRGAGPDGPGRKQGPAIGPGGTTASARFVHKGAKAPKMPDKKRDDYHKQKKKVEAAKDRMSGPDGGAGGRGRSGADGAGLHALSGRKVKSEVRNLDAIQKERKLKARRQERNGRPSKKIGKGRK